MTFFVFNFFTYVQDEKGSTLLGFVVDATGIVVGIDLCNAGFGRGWQWGCGHITVKIKKATQEQCSCKVSCKQREKFKAVSNPVWVCLKAMILEKTIQEKWTYKKYSNDNYSYIAPASLNTYLYSLILIPFDSPIIILLTVLWLSSTTSPFSVLAWFVAAASLLRPMSKIVSVWSW